MNIQKDGQNESLGYDGSPRNADQTRTISPTRDRVRNPIDSPLTGNKSFFVYVYISKYFIMMPHYEIIRRIKVGGLKHKVNGYTCKQGSFCHFIFEMTERSLLAAALVEWLKSIVPLD